LEGVEHYPLLLIPTGGLSGLDSSETFKTRLDAYVRNGGTVIVFSQQLGSEYEILPGVGLEGMAG